MVAKAVGYDLTAAPGTATAYIYDQYGNLTSQTDALGRQTTYTYDTFGRQLTVTPPVPSGATAAGITTTNTYDALGNLTYVAAPQGRNTSYVYDQNGNKTSMTDPNGHVTAYTYDGPNRLAKVTYPTAPATYTTYAYDFRNNAIDTTMREDFVTNSVTLSLLTLRRETMKMLHLGSPALLLVAFSYAHPSVAAPQAPKPVASAAANEQVSPEEAARRKDWSHSMLLKPAPKKGCFTSAYPSTEWQQVPCGPKRKIPMIPRHGPRPNVVGNNNDISAQAPSGHISQAVGHFENVTNVTSESGPIGNAGPSIANTYTLQINTNFFGGTSVCAASPNPGCQGWQQFVYENDSSGSAYIQYWIIAYNATCPAGQSWNQIALYGGTYCWKNNSAGSVSVPLQPITNIGNWTLSGQVSATGDSVSMSTGTNVYKQTGDNAVDAANGWTTAEFNLFGDGGNSSGGGTATFNSGASVNTRTEIIYGGTSAPNCAAQGFTAEMNNLSFGPTAPTATMPGPAVIFQESIAGGATSNCAAASTIGDTHLHTFQGLLYDFQAAGDFTLANVDPGFSVQTRQVSGAPTWPNATVNKAVAARFGKTRVAICLAPTGGDQTPRVNVDGKLTPVGDGSTLALPEGVGISREGNVYQITSEGGDSVTATVNTPVNATHWINVAVGLGTWPSSVDGLIANANGNLNQIEARDHFVLTNPFNFEDLYHRFADSWRVSAEDSMLSVCNTERGVESGAPSAPFFARDLEAGVREKARGVCTAAGVTAGPLLEACTLDVAVIGDDSAAKAFAGAIPPAAVATLVGVGGGLGGMLIKWWWLLLLLLLALILIVWSVTRKK